MRNSYTSPSFQQLSTEPVGERVLTVDDLSKLFNVSTKTISRWHDEGLVGGQFRFNGRKRLGFLQSSVDNFVRNNSARVRRGTQFSHLTDDERLRMIDDARRLVSDGRSRAEVVRRLAERTGRSVETIRYTIKDHDRQHPDRAVFANGTGVLSEETKQSIYGQIRQGQTIDTLAKRFNQPKAKIIRVIREARALRIMELPLENMPSKEFNKANAKRRILGPMPQREKPARKSRIPEDLPAYLASLYDTPLLTGEQEVYLFRKYNYLKYRATKLREQLDLKQPKSRLMDEIERLYQQAVDTKNQIIQANLRLVVSVVKRYASDGEQMFDLVSDGNMSLIRAVEKFDYTRGFKLSTYATWAIKNNSARQYAVAMTQNSRFKTSRAEVLFDQPDSGSNPHHEELIQQEREGQVNKILRTLDERERRIIVSRFGLGPHEEPKTLKKVGEEFGVSKERIRQLESRAIHRLREAAQEAKLEDPMA